MNIGPFVLPRMFAVHTAAAMVGVLTLVLFVHGLFVSESITSCSHRYNNGAVYGLETRTGLLTPSDLQAGLAGRDFGVMENLDIVQFKDAPAKVGLRVRLAALESRTAVDSQIDNGIDFGWQPKRMPSTAAACLSYSLRVPADFRHGDGGRLPSLVGAPSDAAGEERAIAAQLMWSYNGTLSYDVKAEPNTDGSISATAVTSDTALPAGVWVRVEQEVILNTPGEENGEIRLWIDGELKLRRDGLLFRRDAKTVLNGLAVTVAYNGSRSETSSQKPPAVEVSTFEIRWP